MRTTLKIWFDNFLRVKMNNEIKYLISRTKKAISILNKSEMYVKKWGAESYMKELDLVREDINFIANSNPEEAKNLMLDFIDTSYSIFDRITDKDFVIEDFFQKCVEDLVEIFGRLPLNIQEIVEAVYSITCMYDLSYGYCFNYQAVSSFKELLSKENGFDRLKDKLTERLNKTKKKRVDFIDRLKKALDEITRYKELS